MCAARGDLFAVFSLPQHYREEETVAHLAALRSKQTDFLDDRTLSFGAVWHPWLSGREENRFDEIRSAPPCGATSGALAKRALARGAWVAPANEPLSEVVAIEPRMQREERLNLQEARLNLIRQEPRGFLSLGSDTLSDDPELRQINVRRLLSLLRRLALKHGATYVFEPNSLLFQRAVKRGFEAFLNQMFTRGAFAGATAATSYQVVVDGSLNTPRSMELGRFIVELRFAPSLPLRFLTVRLVQTGDRGFTQEV
jgi:phage tail sheath protein FI